MGDDRTHVVVGDFHLFFSVNFVSFRFFRYFFRYFFRQLLAFGLSSCNVCLVEAGQRKRDRFVGQSASGKQGLSCPHVLGVCVDAG